MLCLCSVLLAWHLSVSRLSVVYEEHVPLVTQNLSVCGGSRPEWSSDYDVIFFYISPSSFLCFFYFCMCHAVRGKSLQPDCEMMSQIHKTLTSSFQLLFIIYHPYFIFLWEDLYGCVQAYMCWRTLGCVCVAVVVLTCVSSLALHGVVQFIHSDTYKPLSSRLSSLRCESLPHIWLGTEVKVAEQSCSTIKAFRLAFFPLLQLPLIMASLFSGHHH